MLLGRVVPLSDLSFQYQKIPDVLFLHTVSISHVMAAPSFTNDMKVVVMAQKCVLL